MPASRSDGSVARGAVATATAPRGRWGTFRWLLVGATAAVAAWTAGTHVADRRADAATPVAQLAHVHGMDAPAWADGALLVATHTGLVRWSEASGWRTVGTDRHDLMGFRADTETEGVLYASGHPDLRRALSNPLGLIVSRDGGRSWVQRSLGGVADLHALASTGGDRSSLLAWDAIASALLRSDDGGATWTTVPSATLAAAGGVLALEVHPTAPDRVFAATARGLWRSEDGGASWVATGLQGAPVTVVRQLDEALWAFAIGEGAQLQRSFDDGSTWARVAAPIRSDAYATAIAASAAAPDSVFVATSTADVLRSDDRGTTWTPMVVAGEVP